MKFDNEKKSYYRNLLKKSLSWDLLIKKSLFRPYQNSMHHAVLAIQIKFIGSQTRPSLLWGGRFNFSFSLYFSLNFFSSKFEFTRPPHCIQIHVSLYHEAYAMKLLWHTVKIPWTIKARDDLNELRKIYQWKCDSNLWKHHHFEASIKGNLIGISFPNFVNIWNHISSSI